MCVTVLPVCMSVYYMNVYSSRSLKRGSDSLDLEMHCVCWESSLGPL